MPHNRRPLCRACQKNLGICGGYLCKRCYAQPELRAQHPRQRGRGRPGGAALPPLPPADPGPTAHRPGSEEFLSVLAARASLGLPLGHHEDAGGRADLR